MKIRSLVLAVLAVSAAVPAIAQEAQDGRKMDIRYDAKRDKYCVSMMITGSRLPQTDCRSRKDWAADGVEIVDQKPQTYASK